jgi:hypothetical protein
MAVFQPGHAVNIHGSDKEGSAIDQDSRTMAEAKDEAAVVHLQLQQFLFGFLDLPEQKAMNTIAIIHESFPDRSFIRGFYTISGGCHVACPGLPGGRTLFLLVSGVRIALLRLPARTIGLDIDGCGF